MNRSVAVIFILLFTTLLKAQFFKGNLGFMPFNSSANLLSYGNEAFLHIHKDTVKKAPEVKKHSAKKATIYSMLLPGLGQAYNRKYWKIPIIYTCMVGTGMFLKYSQNEMIGRQNALKAIKDGDPNTNPPLKYARISEAQLKADRDYWRANRDYAIIAMALFYTMNILDAAVDAHFYQFNIDKPLAMQKKRHIYAYASEIGNKPSIGLSFRF